MRTGEIQSVAPQRRRRTARELHALRSKFIKPHDPGLESSSPYLKHGAAVCRVGLGCGGGRAGRVIGGKAAHPDNAAFLDVFQQPEDEPMASHRNEVPHKELKTSRQIFDESMKIRRQIDDGRPRKSEDDLQRELFGPRGVLGQPDPARMVPQRKKKTPTDFDPGHTA